VPELRERLCAYAGENLVASGFTDALAYEAELPLDRLTPALAAWVERLAPFGMENPEPVFLARAVRICGAPRVMKERHLRLLLAQQPGGPQTTALAWNWAARFATLGLGDGASVDVAYRIRPAESWRGRAAKLELEIVGLRAAQ
jgi:single-stranded-DNA-specific exonuclease